MSPGVAVERWSPTFAASSADDDTLPPSPGQVDVTVERPATDWSPILPLADPAACVRFVDGVQRIDAQVWVTGVDGAVLPGRCVSIAAGALCCDEAATVEVIEVRRLLLGPPATPALGASNVVYEPRPVVDPDDQKLAVQLSTELRQLENAVARQVAAAGDDGDLLVLDGPLNGRLDVPGAVGYVKTHHVAYLDGQQAAVLRALEPGERTPVFLVTTRVNRWSWYVRLPGHRDHAMSGVVRCEAATTVPVQDVGALADRVTATLPRFASSPHREARAPQNLTPIAGLEARLKHRLGDRYLLERLLRRAAR